MTNRVRLACVAALVAMVLQGCAFNRVNVRDLAIQQQNYYAELRKTLEAEKELLQRGLELQVNASAERRENLAQWTLDLHKAEVLLQVNPDVTGNERLLSNKLAEIDLAAIENAEYNRHEAERAAAYLELYDNLITATKAFEKNNKVLIEYLSASDSEFALRNLDVEGVVRAISGMRDLQESLGKTEERYAEDKKAENERLQKHIERARDVLLKALEAGQG
ncbi:MAG: hypothetical protein OER22_06930 [Gammaproteobacteria bacterium]|nr:hypothetical protein [Gammaproteobacteria bacterium]MDH3373321.1 hypothetical protein [Gammaproteobacteria bacterium]MDH3408160.1 hypothetical protein [Gammaproteobacteria bacterium]MDH3552332.1 hypothetical protein [Gammaproteobacteria bacterium]